MKDRPIISTAEEVRAILDGDKSMTRRVVRFPNPGWELVQRPEQWGEQDADWAFIDMANPIGTYPTCVRCPFGVPGDRLWVRESWHQDREHNRVFYRADADESGHVPYLMDGAGGFGGGVGLAIIHDWKSPIYMPRRLSRITLERTTEVVPMQAKAHTADDYNPAWAKRGPKWNHGRTIAPEDGRDWLQGGVA